VTPEVRKEYQRSRSLIIKYGITAREYDAILAKQRGVCFICSEPPKKSRLAVEHRHGDGLLRGLVCWQCNKAIAYIRDNPDRAARLLEFLMYPPAVMALKRQVYGRLGRVTRKWRTKKERAERMASVAEMLKADKAYYEGRDGDGGSKGQQESESRSERTEVS
jgi:hypothetical protein